MTLKAALILAFVASGVALAGCGGSGNSGSNSVATTPAATSPVDHFGAQFAVDFRAAANSTPVKPQAGDIIPLDLTIQPYPIH